MSNDNPQIVDRSSLTGVFVADTFLPIGVEGHASGGDATLGLPETISSAEEATAAFGADSSLTNLISLILSRGIDRVTAVSSDPTHGLPDRQAAWEALEDDPTIRIRLTDDPTQATLVALAESCEDAESIQNKQFCFGGLATPSSKATLGTAAAAINSKRGVLVGPGVYYNGDLVGGASVAALVAAEVSKNPDITDSLNLAAIPSTNGIELQAATGLPLFRLRANGGSPIDDFQDLLDDGVSPLKTNEAGAAAISHLRTTFTDDDTFDALQTLLIKDEVFIGVREVLRTEGFLRKPNTATIRSLAAAIVNSFLTTHATWVSPVALPNGTIGYGVTTKNNPDSKGYDISYFGEVIRGTNVISINGTLSIPV